MVIIDTDAVHHHTTVVVELDAAAVAHGAVVHPWQFWDQALIAIFEFTVVFHLEIYYRAWLEIMVENERVEVVGKLNVFIKPMHFAHA